MQKFFGLRENREEGVETGSRIEGSLFSPGSRNNSYSVKKQLMFLKGECITCPFGGEAVERHRQAYGVAGTVVNSHFTERIKRHFLQLGDPMYIYIC